MDPLYFSDVKVNRICSLLLSVSLYKFCYLHIPGNIGSIGNIECGIKGPSIVSEHEELLVKDYSLTFDWPLIAWIKIQAHNIKIEIEILDNNIEI